MGRVSLTGYYKAIQKLRTMHNGQLTSVVSPQYVYHTRFTRYKVVRLDGLTHEKTNGALISISCCWAIAIVWLSLNSVTLPHVTHYPTVTVFIGAGVNLTSH